MNLTSFETQRGTLNRDFRLSGIAKNTNKPAVYIDGMQKWCWIHIFRYLDDNDFFALEVDYYGKIKRI